MLSACISTGSSHDHKMESLVPRVTWKKNPVENEERWFLLWVFVFFSLSANKSLSEALQLPSPPARLIWHTCWITRCSLGLVTTPSKVSFALKRRRQELHLLESPWAYGSRLEHVDRRHPWVRATERPLFSVCFSQNGERMWYSEKLQGEFWVLQVEKVSCDLSDHRSLRPFFWVNHQFPVLEPFISSLQRVASSFLTERWPFLNISLKQGKWMTALT